MKPPGSGKREEGSGAAGKRKDGSEERTGSAREDLDPEVVTLPSSRVPLPASRRLLAVDYGERRIGLAISDPTGTIASPAGYIVRRAGKRPPVAELIRRAEALEARGFVLGLPLDDNGDETPRSAEVRSVGAELERRTGLPASFVDERYTTAAALRAVREMGGTARGRKGDVDALAATILLQHALRLAH